MIRRVLIANRGEIAVRILRTCRDMGFDTVAVYSDVDRDAPHVALADDAVRLGPAPAADSYLRADAILDAARRTHADTIHPGYGFLSENAAFARDCESAGLRFVGPPATVIEQMGSKTAARTAVTAAGVPVVPGEAPADQSNAALEAAIETVGFPALLKATAGGGGKGMRIVRTRSDAADAIDAARRESARAFGDGTLYVERLIDVPRHIEVQIIGDQAGNLVHLFERDCTLQRRHQKVIEEAPAPTLTPTVREQITQAALRAARAVGYVNAGTVEFLLEGRGDDARFYFLEMNTRLQVEHPVTEMITGLDLVRLQLLVAAGEALPFTQADVEVSGHAIECRVYAEDPRRLLPQSGRLIRYREPSGEGVRVDSGVAEGQTITVHYDPLLAKLTAHAATREGALARLSDAIDDFDILGLHHNLAFLRTLLNAEDVRANATDTQYIERHMDRLVAMPHERRQAAAATLAAFVASGPRQRAGTAAANDPWLILGPIAW